MIFLLPVLVAVATTASTVTAYKIVRGLLDD
jgi:hypothetical protein